MSRLNATEWDKHYAHWQTSKMSLSSFCKQEGINYQRLCYWRQIKEGTKKRQAKKSGSFIHLNNKIDVHPTSPNKGFNINFPSGIIISFQELPPVEYLKSLLA